VLDAAASFERVPAQDLDAEQAVLDDGRMRRITEHLPPQYAGRLFRQARL
jgi:hypothetical protein